MARGYDRHYGYGVDYREVDLRPRYDTERSADPNYRGGGYHGMRMEPGQRGQAAYGWFRQSHARDLGESGGFAGRYGGHRRGEWDGDGLYRDPFDREHPTNLGHAYDRQYGGGGGMRRGVSPDPAYDAEFGVRYVSGTRPREDDLTQRSDGGVREDTRFLRQYNRDSVAFREGRGYDRSFGWADGRPGGPREERTREHGFQGYNSGGFSEKQIAGGSGPRPTGR